jgi:hypothetical protein
MLYAALKRRPFTLPHRLTALGASTRPGGSRTRFRLRIAINLLF